jgi:hypothetical protein
MLLLPWLGRDWWRRYWPLALVVGVQAVLWFLISPIARFAYPWIPCLMLLACAPLMRRQVPRALMLVPLILVVCAVPPVLSKVQIFASRTRMACQGENDERYLVNHFPREFGCWIPPIEGILRLNGVVESSDQCRVAVDHNMLAYADFQTVALPYYLMAFCPSADAERIAAVQSGRMEARELIDDSALLRDLVEKLNVRYFLIGKQKIEPPHPERNPFASAIFVRMAMDRIADHWVAQGLLDKQELSDSFLYTVRMENVRSWMISSK